MGISENRNCKFCTDEIDYIEHFFWFCGKINLIWKKSRVICIFEIRQINKIKIKGRFIWI